MNSCAITTTEAEKTHEAFALATRYQLPFVAAQDANQQYAFYLNLTDNGLVLIDNEHHDRPFTIDFSASKAIYRLKTTSFRKELLARALGVTPRERAFVVDATAGLGRDSFMLAGLGFHITLLERSPVLYLLLADAIAHGGKHPELAAIVGRMQLIHANAIDWLNQRAAKDRPAVIYIDPMYPDRRKQTKAKKEMVLLQTLLPKTADDEQLFTTALTCATARVVVKRPRIAANIAGIKPTYSLLGKSSRFDIYLT